MTKLTKIDIYFKIRKPQPRAHCVPTTKDVSHAVNMFAFHVKSIGNL